MPLEHQRDPLAYQGKTLPAMHLASFLLAHSEPVAQGLKAQKQGPSRVITPSIRRAASIPRPRLPWPTPCCARTFAAPWITCAASAATPSADPQEEAAVRDAAEQIRQRCLSRLPDLLEQLEANCERNGIKCTGPRHRTRPTPSSSASPSSMG